MKTQQEIQVIYDIIISELSCCDSAVLHHIADRRQKNPLQDYLEGIKEQISAEDFNEAFLKRTYAEAFHIGDIPKNRNHIICTSALTIGNQPTSPLLTYWIDLDKVAAMTNAHFNMTPSMSFKVKYYAHNGTARISNWTVHHSSAVNSVYSPNDLYISLFMGAICSGILSGVALGIAILALMSLVTLSTAGIYTAIGVSVFAAVISYGLFKAKDSQVTTNPECTTSQSVDIVAVFQQHFEATIRGPNAIPSDERVEVLEENYTP
jgi:hypothetical protein